LAQNVGRENGPWSDDCRRNAALVFLARRQFDSKEKRSRALVMAGFIPAIPLG
jgi:hypothetical protein